VIDVVTIGETMAALRSASPLKLGGSLGLSIAGAESNVAIGLARLGHRVRWVGRTGADELGELVRRTLRAENVDLEYSAVDSAGRPTGLILFERRIGDLVRVAYYRAGSAGSALRADDVFPALSADVRILHVTGITPALSTSACDAVRCAAEWARANGTTVCLDVNYRSRLWSAEDARTALRPLAEMADIVIASPEELTLLADDPETLLADGVREVVVKQGADGATAFTAEGHLSEPARPVVPIDPVGAGDAFTAGYLSAGLDGLGLGDRLRRAVTLGAFAVATSGDWEGLPTRAELDLLDGPAGTTLR
jgi:2-dehydro-3-deoxygluconokinase